MQTFPSSEEIEQLLMMAHKPQGGKTYWLDVYRVLQLQHILCAWRHRAHFYKLLVAIFASQERGFRDYYCILSPIQGTSRRNRRPI